MKYRVFGIVAFMGLFAMFAVTASAQKTGGYKEISKDDAGAAAAAEFAVSAEAEEPGKSIDLVSVQKAERQIVAGTNYRLCIKVTSQGADGEADATHTVQVVVYVDLKGNSKLTSWVTSDCGGDDDDGGGS